MNKGRIYLFILLLIGVIYISCENKIAVAPVTPTNTNTKAPIVYGSPAWGFNGGNYLLYDYLASYEVTYKNNILVISLDGTIEGASWPNAYWTIQFYAKETGTYILSNKNIGQYSWSELFGGHYTNGSFNTDSIHTGKVTLTVLDTINHVVSGTFWYACEEQAPTVNGGVDSVTNGYFTNLKW